MTSNTGSQGRPDGAALALARELENLRRTVARVEATAASAKETAETAVRTAARTAGRNDQVEGLRTQLGEVVPQLLVRHQAALDCLPPCWMFHGEVVEDLLWLKACWVAAHRAPDAKPTAAADWHERWLPGVTGRLRHRMGTGGCSFTNHQQASTEYRIAQERHPDQRVPAIDPDTAAAYARWWVQTRGRSDATPPGLPAPRPQQGGTQPPRGWGQ
jgi:hypothetical protein